MYTFDFRGFLAGSRTDHRGLLALVVVASWLALPGCRPADDDDPGGCTTASDCATGERCVDGACVPAPDAGGATCADIDCNDGNPCNGVEACDDAGECGRGTPLAAGSACDVDGSPTTREFCVAGGCVPSRCGDGVVDTAGGEVCDDGNSTDGDGCDSCRYSCTEDSECDDGDECSGTETCDTAAHVCVAGTALAEDADCNEGLGRCAGGVCFPRTCEMASDCDDGNPCNGTEACTAEGCAAGPALSCDDENECTTDRCDPAAASPCVHRLIDADNDGHAPSGLGTCGDDCDDSDPIVFTGADDLCDGLDNDCDTTVDEGTIGTWYVDCDGDGYAATGATMVESCARPAPGLAGCATGGGWTTRSPARLPDCNDTNASVSPGQTMPQSTPIPGAPAESDFDYNCDGVETLTYPNVGSCGRGCTLTQGFATRVAPCGATMSSFISSCRSILSTCIPTQMTVTQTCR